MQYQNLMINMAKKIKDIKLADFPEEVDENGLKWYGEMSYETLIAVLSHHLHTGKKKFTAKEKEEIIYAVREFLARKKYRLKEEMGMTNYMENMFNLKSSVCKIWQGQTYGHVSS